MLLSLLDRRLHISHVVLGVSDVEMFTSRKVLLGLIQHLDVSDVGVEKWYSDFTSNLVDLVSNDDVCSHRVH